MEESCGYMVVRLPAENFDPEGRGAFSAKVPIFNGIYYGGLDRLPWFDIDEAYYSGRLPIDLRCIRRSLKEINLDFSGIDLLKSLSEARQMLDYSNRESQKNEIITVYSEMLRELKGAIKLESSVNWIGCDIINLGHSSLLHDGIFSNAELFMDFQDALNENGLIRDETTAKEYIMRYCQLAEQGLVEEIIDEPYGVDCVWVACIK